MKSAYHITLCVLLLLTANITSLHAEKPTHEIKFASLAPEGSAWMNQMHELDDAVREVTNGEVGFKLYPGGVQGDEPDVLRKMRFNQIHAAGFTGNGLGEILPEVRLLELPFMFRNKDEIDYIVNQFTDQYDQAFRGKGYVLLGWTEVGYIYFFSNKPLNTLEDLNGVKVWTWQGDPLPAALFDAIGVTPVPLSVTEVMTALQTGMIDAVYTSPMAAISLQWFTRTKYMNTLPITNSMGAVLLSKNVWDKLDEYQQTQLLELSREHMRRLTMITREDNATSIDQIERSGITLLSPPGGHNYTHCEEIGLTVRDNLTGKLYSEEWLKQIENSLAEFRATVDSEKME